MARKRSYLGSASGPEEVEETQLGLAVDESEDFPPFVEVEPQSEPVEEVVETVPEPVDPVVQQLQEIEAEPVSKSGPDFEKIAKVLFMYLEEIDKADKEFYKDHSLVRGIARNVVVKRLKWGNRVNGAIEWKV